ncbi:MAG: sensor histidine kinase, partial [Myxococcota bacterium]
MPGEPLLSTRARPWRDWLLFALAALLPALAVGWIGLRALQGEEEASRREIVLALQTTADGIVRDGRESFETAAAKLRDAQLPSDHEALSKALATIAPRFAEPVVAAPDGDVLLPAPPGHVEDKTPRPAPAHCNVTADAIARGTASASELRRFVETCQQARSPTGRWLWPIVVLRTRATVDPEVLLAWARAHAAQMPRSERRATERDVQRASWIREAERERIVRALGSSASQHEAVAQTLRAGDATSAMRAGPDPSGLVRWRGATSWGVLRQLPGGALAGFVAHSSSIENGLARGWPSLSPMFRASIRRKHAATELVRTASLAPGLSLQIGLSDPELPQRQAERGRWILVLVGTGAMAIAFAVAAVLFARMRAARRLSELRTGFVSTVSHELRTPIASVRMLAELLEEDRVDPEERPEMHAALAREARRLGDTVDRLLGFSRMAAGRYVVHKQRASVVDTVAQSIDTFEERHPESAPVQRLLPVSLDAEIDAGQLQLAVDNLLANARKHAPNGTP